MNVTTKIVSTSLALASAASFSFAGTSMVAAGKSVGKGPQPQPTVAEKNPLEQIWGLASLYSGGKGFFNDLSITGRYHGQYHNTDGGKLTDSDWDNRRFRVGLKGHFLDKALEIKSEIFSNLNSGGHFYEGFTELYAAYTFSDALTINIGKQKPKFGQEWSTSSRLISTFERSLLTNFYKPDYSAGVSLSGKSGATSYYAGVFANDPSKEMSDFNGGYSIIANVDQDVKDVVGTEKASVGVGYIHSEHESIDTIFSTIDDGISLHGSIKQGALGVSAEALYLMGNSDTVGLSIIPTYDITKKLQLALRYQLASTDGEFAGQKRYEKAAGLTKGDVYNSVYAGLNYFILDDRLKVMAGVEYSDLNDSGDTLSFLAGVRAYW
jgi:phosphate-selective porin OprO and OprP